MDYKLFYAQLFAPLEASLGPIDRDTLVAIIGFDAGGPLNFSTIGAAKGGTCITYISCELAVRDEQVPSEFGRFELLTTCDDERWVRSNLTKIGRLSLNVALGHDHSIDLGESLDPDAFLQGVVLRIVKGCRIDGRPYGIFRVVGISRGEMEFARESGVPALIDKLQKAGVYPNTLVSREPVV